MAVIKIWTKGIFSKIITPFYDSILSRKFCQIKTTNPSISIMMGLSLFATTFCLSYAIDLQQKISFDQKVQSKTYELKLEIREQLENSLYPLITLGKLLGQQEKSIFNRPNKDLSFYLKRMANYRLILFLDYDFNVRWVIPEIGNESLKKSRISPNFSELIALEKIRYEEEIALTTHLQGLSSEQELTFVVPLNQSENFYGFIIALLDKKGFFNRILHQKITHDYALSIFNDKGEVLYENFRNHPSDPQLIKEEKVILPGIHWILRVWPEPQLLEKEVSFLPQWIFLGGSFFSLGLTFAFYFYLSKTSPKLPEKNLNLSPELAESFPNQICENVPNIIYIYNLKNGEILYLNRAIYEGLGYQPDEIKAGQLTFLKNLVHPEDLPHIIEYISQITMLLEEDVFEIEYRLQHRQGEWRNFLSRERVFRKNKNGEPQQIIGTAIDLTENKLLNEELTERLNELKQRNEEITLLSQMGHLLQACVSLEEAWLVISQLMPILFPQNFGGIFRMNQDTQLLEAVILWGNPTTTEELFSPQDCLALRNHHPHFIENTLKGLVCSHLHHNPPTMSFCVPIISHGDTLGLLYIGAGLQKNMLDNSSLSQSNLFLSTHRLLSKARQQLAITVGRQISIELANLRLRATLRNQSIRDSLTGLFNRRYLEESLQREIHQAQKQQKTLGIIMLDVDHFKTFNDTFGHDAGDTVLREIGDFLRKNLSSTSICCRYGGEELTVILPDTSLEKTIRFAEKLREGIRQLTIYHREQLLGQITSSLGVACFPLHGQTGSEVLQKADQALYQAKRSGRDRVISAD